MNSFFKWWRDVGSGMRPIGGEDTEEFARRIAHSAYIAAIDEKHLDRMVNTPPVDGFAEYTKWLISIGAEIKEVGILQFHIFIPTELFEYGKTFGEKIRTIGVSFTYFEMV